MVNLRKIFRQIKYALLLSMVCLTGLTSSAQAYTAMETKGYRIQVFTDPDPFERRREPAYPLTGKVYRYCCKGL